MTDQSTNPDEPKVTTIEAEDAAKPSATHPDLGAAEAFELARDALMAPGEHYTLAEPAKDGPHGSLLDHREFHEKVLKSFIEKPKSVEELLLKEQEILEQIERIEVVQQALDRSEPSAMEFRNYLVAGSEDADAYFEVLLKKVKSEDRSLETAVRSFHAFLAESGIDSRDDLRSSVCVLNVDPEELLVDPDFGQHERFGGVDGLGEVHKNVYGLWVLGGHVESTGEVQNIGRKALQHTAMSVLNIETDSRIPEQKRRDVRGFQARLADGLSAVEALAPTPLNESDVRYLQKVTGDVEGLERTVLCFSPLRVRRASRYDEQGDVTVPSSFAYGGKIAYCSMVSMEHGIATNPSMVKKAFQIGSYADDSDDPIYSKCWLYDFEGHIDDVEKYPAVFGMTHTGAGSEQEMKQSLAHFGGVQTARGSDYQVNTALAYDFLRRCLTVLGRAKVGEPTRNKEVIRKEVEDFLHRHFLADGKSGDRKPFTRISVEHAVPEGLPQGAIAFTVRVDAPTVIPELAVTINAS